MAVRIRSSSESPATHQLGFYMFLLFHLYSSFLLSTASASNDRELRLLLSFKASLHDPLHVLSDWKANNAGELCWWLGITCDNSSRVISVVLSSKNFSGRISPQIFKLPAIGTLDLSNNQLTGDLPINVFGIALSSLRHLNLSNNNLTGAIPTVGLASLELLDISNNMLSGRIPDDVGNFSRLKFLDLGGNTLSGTMPVSLSNLSALVYLTLASNQLSGEIPREICKIKSLKWIYLGYNNFSGKIPTEIGGLSSLRHLDLVYNNLTGPIPESLGNLTELRYLFLYQNKLVGPIQSRLVFALENLVSLDLSDNALSGEIPETISRLQQLEILHLFSNKLTGMIPVGLARLRRLQVLQLWSNKLYGHIPEDLGRRNNLTILDLSTNRLTGKIPAGLCNSGRLFKLILFTNFLDGDIPEGVSQCKSLRRVRLQNNWLSGKIPAEFLSLPLTYFLDISENKFSGHIDLIKWDMPSLQMLNLGANRFSGNLPESFGSQNIENLVVSTNRFSGTIPLKLFFNLSKMVQLDLSHNELSGYIPKEISSCERLVSIDMSHNQLVGEIPASLAEMPVLGQLDLSWNHLSGEIPRHLGRVESLVQVNISYNHLHGSLPATGAFLAINATAVAGNNGLCGSKDASAGLPLCREESIISNGHHPARWLVLTCLFTAVLVLFVSVSVVALRRGKSGLEVRRVENDEYGTWEIQFFEAKLVKSVRIEDIISSAKQGKGTLCASNNKQLVVKEVGSVPTTTFWSEVEEVGRKVRHRNVVRLMGFCRSHKDGYLVYEHIEGIALSQILTSLSWERRRKIAVGVAKAMHFLHGSAAVVGNFSPEDIAIDGNDEPHMSLRVRSYEGLSSSAPGCAEASKGSESDIYGFGLILIQLLTGKCPASFVDWARYCYSECHVDSWVDPAIRGDMSTHHNAVVEAMNLALCCTAEDPTARPCAAHICKALSATSRTPFCASTLKLTTLF